MLIKRIVRFIVKHIQAILVAVGAIILALWLRGCLKDTTPPLDFSLPLQEETLAQIAVEDHHIAIRTHTDTQAAYVPDTGRVVSQVDKDGKISLGVTNKGFTLRPVIGMGVTTELRGLLGLQLGYWNRFEFYVGGGLPKPVAFTGVGYRLDQFRLLQNTSIAAIYTSGKELGVGLLVRF